MQHFTIKTIARLVVILETKFGFQEQMHPLILLFKELFHCKVIVLMFEEACRCSIDKMLFFSFFLSWITVFVCTYNRNVYVCRVQTSEIHKANTL